MRERLFRVLGFEHLEALGCEACPQEAPDRRLVVDHKKRVSYHRLRSYLSGGVRPPRPFSGLGNVIVNIAPDRSALFAATILPPSASTNPRQIASPSPVRRAGGRPASRGETSRTHAQAGPREFPAPRPEPRWRSRPTSAARECVISDPGGAYFAALSRRLTSTCSNSITSRLSIGRFASRSTSTVMVRHHARHALQRRAHNLVDVDAAAGQVRCCRTRSWSYRAGSRQSGKAARPPPGWSPPARRAAGLPRISRYCFSDVTAPRIEASGVLRSWDSEVKSAARSRSRLGRKPRLIDLPGQPHALDGDRRLIHQRVEKAPLVRRQQHFRPLAACQADDAHRAGRRCARAGRSASAPGSVSEPRPAGRLFSKDHFAAPSSA